ARLVTRSHVRRRWRGGPPEEEDPRPAGRGRGLPAAPRARGRHRHRVGQGRRVHPAAGGPRGRAAPVAGGGGGPGPFPGHPRARQQLARDRARAWQRLEKLLEGALIKLSSELSSLSRVKTARLILDALADGERDLKALAALALGPLRARRGELEAALDGMMIG